MFSLAFSLADNKWSNSDPCRSLIRVEQLPLWGWLGELAQLLKASPKRNSNIIFQSLWSVSLQSYSQPSTIQQVLYDFPQIKDFFSLREERRYLRCIYWRSNNTGLLLIFNKLAVLSSFLYKAVDAISQKYLLTLPIYLHHLLDSQSELRPSMWS